MPDARRPPCEELQTELIRDLNLLHETEQTALTAATPRERQRLEDDWNRLKSNVDRIQQELSSIGCLDLPAELFPAEHLGSRTNLFNDFLKFAVDKDIVIAIGGIGSGLSTFHEQFEKHLATGSARCYPVDFNLTIYNEILEAHKTIAPVVNLSVDQLALKCMLASLAYSTYQVLAECHMGASLIEDNEFSEHIPFSNYFLTHSHAMRGADRGRIVEYFFRTIQDFAVRTRAENVFVFMPLQGIAACLRDQPNNELWHLGRDLWAALGEYNSYKAGIEARGKQSQKYDRVCLVTTSIHAPYGHTTYRKPLVSNCLWPIPPLVPTDLGVPLKAIWPGLDTIVCAKSVIHATAGIPWLVRLVLTFIKHIHSRFPMLGPDTLVQLAVQSSAVSLELDATKVAPGPVRTYVEKYVNNIMSILHGPEAATDEMIEEAWCGPPLKRQRGFRITSSRVEAFTASGLLWFEGDVWDSGRDDYIFSRYPVIRFRAAGSLAIAAYRAATRRAVSFENYQ